MTIQGYANGSLDGDAPRLEGCGATVERYESDLDTALRQVLPRLQQEMRLESVDFELYYRAFLEQLLSYGVLSDHPVERYDAGWLENIEAGAVRVCWLEGEITLPAGGTVNLTAAMTKEGSYNFTCAGVEEQGMYHYDLATRLGSIQAYPMEVEHDGGVVKDSFCYGMVSNTISVGGFKGTPTQPVALDDGLFEVALVRQPQNPLQLQGVLKALSNMAPDEGGLVTCFRTSRLKLTAREAIDWTLDGEFGGRCREAEIVNHRQAVTIVYGE